MRSLDPYNLTTFWTEKFYYESTSFSSTLILTGILKAKTVNPRSLYFRTMSPWRPFVRDLLHANPRPILKSFTKLKSFVYFENTNRYSFQRSFRILSESKAISSTYITFRNAVTFRAPRPPHIWFVEHSTEHLTSKTMGYLPRLRI